MVFLVPYDGSHLAKAALTRASEYANALEVGLTVVTVTPNNSAYAVEKGWYDESEDEPFSIPYVTGKLHTEVSKIAPRAAFRHEEIEFESPPLIAERIEEVADEIMPAVVFIGTDNVGEIAKPLTSVAGSVAEDAEYDVHIVRYFSPSKMQELSHEEEAYPST